MTVPVPAIRGRHSDGQRVSNRVLHVVDHSSDGHRPAVLERILDQRRDDEMLPLASGGRVGQPAWLMSARWILGGDDGGVSAAIKVARAEGRPFRLIHGWGARALSLVGYAQGCDGRLATIDRFLSDAPAAMQASNVLRSGRVSVTFSSARARYSMMQLAGPATNHTDADQLHCMAVHPDQLSDHRQHVRNHWGVGPEAMVIGLLGDPMSEINLRALSGIPVRCRILGRDAVIVMSSSGARRGDLIRWMERVAPGLRMVIDDALDRPRDVVKAMDLVLAPAAVGRQSRICSVEPVMAAVAAGVPVMLGEDHPASEWAADEPLIWPEASADEHAATKWLFSRTAESMSTVHDRVIRRCDQVHDSIMASYDRILGSNKSAAAS